MLRLGFLVLLLMGAEVSAQTISGRVVDAHTLLPVADARITLQAGDGFVLSDSNGAFSLPQAGGGEQVVVAAKKGYFYTSATVVAPAAEVELQMRSVAQMDNPDYTLWRPQDCAVCHPRQYNEWTATPMARAGFNTWVHDLYSGTGTVGGMGGFVYTRDSAHAGTNPASECASCHQPQGWLEAPFSALDDAVGNPAPGVMHGVSCEICHKVADVAVDKINFPGLFPGAMTFTRPEEGQVQYGVLGDVAYQQPGLMEAAYQPDLLAETCGLCHQDKNDPGGTHDYDGVISEPTYLEWAESPYGDPDSLTYQSCVNCHMPVAGSNEVCSVVFPSPPRRPEQVRSHQILGTTAEYLENAVQMQVSTQLLNDHLSVDVALFNSGTGHHVPTGVTVRNMILLVEAWPVGGTPLTDGLPYMGTQRIHDLGGVGDPRQGYYAGLPGKFYAKVNHDANNQGPVFYTEAAGITFDNRLPALATDRTQYTFAVPQQVAEVQLRVRLIYRRAFRFLVDAKQWTTDGHGNPLADIAPPHFGELMEEFTTVVDTRGVIAMPIPVMQSGWRFLLVLLVFSIAGYVLWRESLHGNR